MGLLNDPQRDARAHMAQAERDARAGAAGDSPPRQPRRYKLYDKIKDRVSVTTMNVIICATVLLLVIALFIGIVTGNPQ